MGKRVTAKPVTRAATLGEAVRRSRAAHPPVPPQPALAAPLWEAIRHVLVEGMQRDLYADVLACHPPAWVAAARAAEDQVAAGAAAAPAPPAVLAALVEGLHLPADAGADERPVAFLTASVRAICHVLRMPAHAERRAKHTTFITDALAGEHVGEDEMRGLRQGLGRTLARAWRCGASNRVKEGWWRATVNGIATAKARGWAPGPCPCGFPAHGQAPQPHVGLDMRAHALWDCAIADAVVSQLQRVAGPGVPVERRHVWLMEVPAGLAVELPVWRLVCVLAVHAMLAGRRCAVRQMLGWREQHPGVPPGGAEHGVWVGVGGDWAVARFWEELQLAGTGLPFPVGAGLPAGHPFLQPHIDPVTGVRALHAHVPADSDED